MHVPLKDYRDLLWRYLAPQRVRVLVLGLLLCVEIALQLINPQLLRIFIDTVTAYGPQPALLGVTALFIGIAILAQIVTIYATYSSGRRPLWIYRGTTARHRGYSLQRCTELYSSASLHAHSQTLPDRS